MRLILKKEWGIVRMGWKSVCLGTERLNYEKIRKTNLGKKRLNYARIGKIRRDLGYMRTC